MRPRDVIRAHAADRSRPAPPRRRGARRERGHGVASRRHVRVAATTPRRTSPRRVRSMMEPGGCSGSRSSTTATERTVPGPDGDDPDPCVRAADGRRRLPLDPRRRVHDGEPSRAATRPTGRWRRTCNVAVVSPEYRMAPEHVAGGPRRLRGGRAVAPRARSRRARSSAPTACSSAARARARTSRRSPRCACATVTTRWHRVGGANLNCGVYDLTGTPSRVLPPPEHDVLAAAGSGAGTPARRLLRVGRTRRAPRARRVAALRRPARPLPRAVHRRHGRLAARRLGVHGLPVELAGNDTELAVYPVRPARPHRLAHRDGPARPGQGRGLHPHPAKA